MPAFTPPLSITALKSREDVARFLGVSDLYLRYILYGRKDRAKYTLFKIPKKGGGERQIASPPKSLCRLQRRIASALLDVHKPKPASHGFLRGRSIATNASRHTRQRVVFNLDLKDFFPTINFGRMKRLLEKEPFSLGRKAAIVVTQICFDAAGKLPQGAPSSPIISNLICRSLDDSLQLLAQRHGCRYTRYADDLTFSTSRPLLPEAIAARDGSSTNAIVGPELSKLVREAGFAVNAAKVRMYRPDRRQEVTGLTVNEDANVRRDFVRELDSVIQCWRKHGYVAASKQYVTVHRLPMALPTTRPGFLLEVLRGKVAFLQMVKGRDDPLPRRLQWALHDLQSDKMGEPLDLAQLKPSTLRGHIGRFRGWQAVGRRHQTSVKFVQVLQNCQPTNYASAFVISPNTLVTAGHVVSDGRVPRIGYDSSGISPIKVCLINETSGRDLALLFFAGTPFKDDAAVAFQYRLPEIGEEVVSLGFPSIAGRDTTIVMHGGIVEALPVGYRSGCRFIQTSFQSGGGLSGGPVFDMRGFVLGLMIENAYLPESTDGSTSNPPRPYGQAVPFEYVARARALILAGRESRAIECGFRVYDVEQKR